MSEKTISLHNRGIRTFRMPGAGGEKVTILGPGETVEVPEQVAKDHMGYKDLVDAAKMAPAQAKRQAALEDENARLKARVEELERKKAPDAPAKADQKGGK